MGKIRLLGRQDMKVAIIGDEDTVIGMGLAGAGAVEGNGGKNFLIVDGKTRPADIEQAFIDFTCSDGRTGAAGGTGADGKDGSDSKGPTRATFAQGGGSINKKNDISIIIITQSAASSIRNVVDEYAQSGQVVPAVLEIPTKDAPYDASKDPIMQRVQMFFGDNDVMADEEVEAN